jgi:hypothetical protein
LLRLSFFFFFVKICSSILSNCLFFFVFDNVFSLSDTVVDVEYPSSFKLKFQDNHTKNDSHIKYKNNKKENWSKVNFFMLLLFFLPSLSLSVSLNREEFSSAESYINLEIM